METKTKVFDCVDFKRRAQEKLMREYESRRKEFSSYGDFINAKVKEDRWSEKLWNTIGSTEERR
jgi:hypothetical protein